MNTPRHDFPNSGDTAEQDAAKRSYSPPQAIAISVSSHTEGPAGTPSDGIGGTKAGS